MEKCTVEIEAWQIQCCGEPFKIGDTIKWLVAKWGETMLSYPEAGIMDYYYEHHSSEHEKLFLITGVVMGINSMYCRFIPVPDNSKRLIRASGYTKPVAEAIIWEKKIKSHRFDGYIVRFDDAKIHPAQKKDVAYS